MKELTYEDWQKNPTVRMMWVWDNDVENKEKRKVVFIKSEGAYPVIAVTSDDRYVFLFKHCAEIEEIEKQKQRRMTYKELSRWLREKPTREYRYITSNFICCDYDYREENQDKEAHEDILIREDDGEWKEPLVEVEE